MRPIRSAVLACLPLLTASICAQTAPAPQPQQASPVAATAPATPAMLSSHAAYEEAMRPLDLTRRDIGNWSDAEVAALNLAIQQAASACNLRDPLHVPVDDLVDLARLCGVGQRWEITMMAAHRYISDPQPSKPQLTQAYADAIEAELHLQMGSAGQQTALAMLKAVPYDGTASGAYNMALDYLQFVDTSGAITLAEAAQPILLDRLKAGSGAAAPAMAMPVAYAAASADTSLTAVQVYRDALRLPALEVLRNHLQQADTLAATVDAAVPAQLGGDDALLIAAERRRFGLLGHRLPLVDVALSLDQQRAPAQELPLPGLTTALLIFPDWCAQCLRMGPQFPEGKFTVGGRAAGFYALLATTKPTSPATTVRTPAATDAAAAKNDPLGQLRGTPTLIVPAATLLQMEATAYPLLVLVDEKGIVRLHQAVGEDALQSGNTMDSAIASLGATAPPAPAPTPHLGTPGATGGTSSTRR